MIALSKLFICIAARLQFPKATAKGKEKSDLFSKLHRDDLILEVFPVGRAKRKLL